MNKKEALKELLINAFKMGASTGIKGHYVVEVDNWLPNFIDANKTLHDGVIADSQPQGDVEIVQLADEIRSIKFGFPRDNRWDKIEQLAKRIEALQSSAKEFTAEQMIEFAKKISSNAVGGLEEHLTKYREGKRDEALFSKH